LAIMVSCGRKADSLRKLAVELREHGLDALTNVLSWSLRALTDEQRTVFALLGATPGVDIGLPAAASLTGLSKPQVTRVLRALAEASLLTRLPKRLVRHARPDPRFCRAAPQPIPDVPTALAWLDDELPNLLAAQRVATGIAVWQLARTVNSFLYRRGRQHDRLAVWQTALAADLPDSARANAHGFLGRAYAALGRMEEATGHFEQALTLAGDDALQQANTHRMLSAAWEQRGDDRRALAHTAHALALYRTLDQPNRGGRRGQLHRLVRGPAAVPGARAAMPTPTVCGGNLTSWIRPVPADQGGRGLSWREGAINDGGQTPFDVA
jgi:tetratricopeptide (TPR) repeat protein